MYCFFMSTTNTVSEVNQLGKINSNIEVMNKYHDFNDVYNTKQLIKNDVTKSIGSSSGDNAKMIIGTLGMIGAVATGIILALLFPTTVGAGSGALIASLGLIPTVVAIFGWLGSRKKSKEKKDIFEKEKNILDESYNNMYNRIKHEGRAIKTESESSIELIEEKGRTMRAGIEGLRSQINSMHNTDSLNRTIANQEKIVGMDRDEEQTKKLSDLESLNTSIRQYRV